MDDLTARLNQSLSAIVPTGYGQDVREAITELVSLRAERDALHGTLEELFIAISGQPTGYEWSGRLTAAVDAAQTVLRKQRAPRKEVTG